MRIINYNKSSNDSIKNKKQKTKLCSRNKQIFYKKIRILFALPSHMIFVFLKNTYSFDTFIT